MNNKGVLLISKGAKSEKIELKMNHEKYYNETMCTRDEKIRRANCRLKQANNKKIEEHVNLELITLLLTAKLSPDFFGSAREDILIKLALFLEENRNIEDLSKIDVRWE